MCVRARVCRRVSAGARVCVCLCVCLCLCGVWGVCVRVVCVCVIMNNVCIILHYIIKRKLCKFKVCSTFLLCVFNSCFVDAGVM